MWLISNILRNLYLKIDPEAPKEPGAEWWWKWVGPTEARVTGMMSTSISIATGKRAKDSK